MQQKRINANYIDPFEASRRIRNNTNNPFGVLYHRRGKADKYSEFLGPENRLFQGKKLAFCSGLTEWARWGQYLFRWQDVFWHLGYSSDEILCNDDLHILANFYIGEQPILRLLKKVENWKLENKEAYFYAMCNNLPRAEIEQANKHLTLNTVQ